jgi:diadenosine tetraphosphatase ApaH/serine/threonine PP2A family protein phosphatase
MKIGIMGDVHGNLIAMQAVLVALREIPCERILCTGDLVGYGPCPVECVHLAREVGLECVLGNHDEYVTGFLDESIERLDADMKASIDWTRSVLAMDDLKWLSALPLHLETADYTVTHGALGPNPWAYIVNRPNLEQHFSHQGGRLAFNGHTHLPLLCTKHDAHPATMDFLRNTVLPQGAKILVNCGSVGQPRDRDPRASCCVYDTAADSIALLRVPYAVAETQAQMRAARLPERFILRLETGR